MNQVTELFDKHLLELRSVAKDADISFVNLLAATINWHRQRTSSSSRMLCLQQQRRNENRLTRQYYSLVEDLLKNAVMKSGQIDIEASLNTDAGKALIKLQHDMEIREANLEKGRGVGSDINKKRAAAVRALVLKTNQEILSNHIYAREPAQRRAERIAETIKKLTVTIDGKNYPAKMVNGKEYSVRTIMDWISGT